MNAEQYRRANANSFNVCIVIFLCGILLTVIKIFQSGFQGAIAAPIIAEAMIAASAP